MDVTAKSEIQSLNYKIAGVDIDAANQLIENIKPIVANTHQPQVLSGIGGFSALYEISKEKYQQPVLVSSTDGIGTKLRLAIEMQKFDTIGFDLVSMCVNDLIVLGATPLYFLDYFATGKLEAKKAKLVIENICEACTQANISLVGGETSEMPGMYANGDFDLAGFATGIVEKSNIIDGKKIAESDVIIGVASSGVHANGFSLINKIIEFTDTDLSMQLGRNTLADVLLKPTKLYVECVKNLLHNIEVRGMAHITGGGLIQNIPRILPNNLSATLNTKAWRPPVIFDWIQKAGSIGTAEMYNTFNCGIGLCIVITKEQTKETLKLLDSCNEKAFVIGEITKRESNEIPQILLSG